MHASRSPRSSNGPVGSLPGAGTATHLVLKAGYCYFTVYFMLRWLYYRDARALAEEEEGED